MVIKMFCDECKKELDDGKNKQRVSFRSKSGHNFVVRFNLYVSNDKKKSWHDGHLCVDCVKKLIVEASKLSGEN